MVSGRRGASAGRALEPLPPVASKAKDYTERPEEVVDELDDLRVRGIAKVLNKHFTTTTKQLAIEKAEADAALADLERRRAQTKAFVPSKGGTLNPYDQMYLRLQQKRAECRRKERETMLLYQRYVMKYGKSAKAEPLVTDEASKDPQETNESASPHPHQDPPGISALGTLDEDSETTFSKFYEKQQQEQDRIKQQNNEKSTQHFMSALNKFMTVTEADEDGQDNDVPELAPSKDSCNPSPASATNDPFMSAINKFTTQAKGEEENAAAKVAEETEAQNSDNDIQSEPDVPATENDKTEESDSRSMIAEASPDAHTDVAVANVVTPEPDREEANVNLHEIKPTVSNDPPGDCVAEDESINSEQDDDASQHHDSGSKKDPPPSPRKSVRYTHSESAEKTAKTVPVTPDVAPGAAALTLSPSSHHSTPRSNKVVRIDVNDGYDFDDRSIISELTTANSAVTRQLLDEVETEMEDFIKCEMEAIRKMLDSEEDASTIEPYFVDHQSEASSLMMGDQSVEVAMKAEAMAREMQKVLDDFAKEDASISPSKSAHDESAEPESEHKNDTPENIYPYKFEPAIPGQDWYVHFDDNYQKEFYVERISNRTQWDYPQKIPTPRAEQQPISSDEFLSDMHSVASSRRSMSRRSSRRSLYRKQRKRRRARRLMVSFVALLCVLVTVFYWRLSHPGESVTTALGALMVSLKSMDMEQIVNLAMDQYEYTFTDRRTKEEQAIFMQQQEEQKRELEAVKRAKEESDRIAKEKVAQQKAAREEAARLARELEAARKAERERLDRARVQREAREERERLARIEAEKMKDSTQVLPHKEEPRKRRNVGCNIPFAYIVPHCWRMAKTNPIFGLKNENDLVFLQ